MGGFGNAFSRELGRNTGKLVSNMLMGNSWSTPHRVVVEKERCQRRFERERARYYKQTLLEKKREERALEREEKEKARKEAEREMEELIASNTKEVEEHNNYIEIIQSVHLDYSNTVDWDEILKEKGPDKILSADELRPYYQEFTNKQVEERKKEILREIKTSFVGDILSKVYNSHNSIIHKIMSKGILPGFIGGLFVILVIKSFGLAFVTCLILTLIYFLLEKRKNEINQLEVVNHKLIELEKSSKIWYEEYLKEQDFAYNKFIKENK